MPTIFPQVHTTATAGFFPVLLTSHLVMVTVTHCHPVPYEGWQDACLELKYIQQLLLQQKQQQTAIFNTQSPLLKTQSPLLNQDPTFGSTTCSRLLSNTDIIHF
jgi:hypothetical protein